MPLKAGAAQHAGAVLAQLYVLGLSVSLLSCDRATLVVRTSRTDADMVFLQAVAGSVNSTTAAAGRPPLVMLLSCGVCTKKGGEGKFLVVSDGCTDPIHKEVAAALDGRGGVRTLMR